VVVDEYFEVFKSFALVKKSWLEVLEEILWTCFQCSPQASHIP